MRDEANEATIHARQAFEILDDPIDPYFVRKAISQNATNVQIELRDVRVEYSGGIVAAEGVTFKSSPGTILWIMRTCWKCQNKYYEKHSRPIAKDGARPVDGGQKAGRRSYDKERTARTHPNMRRDAEVSEHAKEKTACSCGDF
jgi:hypothetical protein